MANDPAASSAPRAGPLSLLSNPVAMHLALIGLGAAVGLTAVALHLLLDRAAELRAWLIASLAGWGVVGFVVWLLLALALVSLAVWLVARFAPEASGSGISQIEELQERFRPIRYLRVLVVKFASGVLGIGAGLALGREGPTVQMGAAIAQGLGSLGRAPEEEQRELVALGAAAGLAGAFNAPIAAMIFLFEELREQFHPRSAYAVLLVTSAADIVGRLFLGQRPELGERNPGRPDLLELPLFLLLGVLTGLAACAFNQGLLATVRIGDRFRGRGMGWAWALIVGAGLAVIAWFIPDAVGSGGNLLSELLAGQVTIRLAVAVLMVRSLLTLGSYSSGAAGGIFAPSLVLGAALGLLYGWLAPLVGSATRPTDFALVGMAGLFAGIVRAPLTGVLLIIEMTQGYSLLLPLLVASAAAKVTANALGVAPIYESLRHNRG